MAWLLINYENKKFPNTISVLEKEFMSIQSLNGITVSELLKSEIIRYILTMKKINIPEALAPYGHYTPAIESNGFLFLSGILPINPYTGEKYNTASFEEQTTIVLNNLETILKISGCSYKKLVKVTAFIKDISYWDIFNKLYIKRLGENKPARTVVPSGNLHYGFFIELDAIAEV